MEEILRLEDVGYTYEEGQEALKNISVTIKNGERIAVLGNNGAGKSTFFLCCNGIIHPDQGRVFLDRKEIGPGKKERMKLHKSVGMVFQDPDNQMIAGTVASEISFGPMNMGLAKDEVRARVDMAIQKMDLKELRNRQPFQLSGGEKKRVGIADVMAMKPRLLMFDEPTANLDPQNTALFEKNLESLEQEGMSLMISTHDVDFAWHWAKRLLVFSDGQIKADTTPEEFFAQDALVKECGLVPPMLFVIGKKFGIEPLPKNITDVFNWKDVR